MKITEKQFNSLCEYLEDDYYYISHWEHEHGLKWDELKQQIKKSLIMTSCIE